jgi:hypothetical protein
MIVKCKLEVTIVGKSKKPFKQQYPSLSKELDENPPSLKLNFDNQKKVEVTEENNPLRGFSPSAVDFIRRCSTHNEALEIISYLEDKEEISTEEAAKLKTQLKTHGLRSFGGKKTWGHYSRAVNSQLK